MALVILWPWAAFHVTTCIPWCVKHRSHRELTRTVVCSSIRESPGFPQAWVSGCDIPEFWSHTLRHGVSKCQLHRRKNSELLLFSFSSKKQIMYSTFFKITKRVHKGKRKLNNTQVHQIANTLSAFFLVPAPPQPPPPQGWPIRIAVVLIANCLTPQDWGPSPNSSLTWELLRKAEFQAPPWPLGSACDDARVIPIQLQVCIGITGGQLVADCGLSSQFYQESAPSLARGHQPAWLLKGPIRSPSSLSSDFQENKQNKPEGIIPSVMLPRERPAVYTRWTEPSSPGVIWKPQGKEEEQPLVTNHPEPTGTTAAARELVVRVLVEVLPGGPVRDGSKDIMEKTSEFTRKCYKLDPALPWRELFVHCWHGFRASGP